MQIIGIQTNAGDDGRKFSTLHLTEEFESYYNDPSAGRSAVGKRVESVYVGEYDISKLRPGMNIDISYEKAMKTRKGDIFQPVKEIVILDSPKSQQ